MELTANLWASVLRFEKWHGLGNDFVVVEASELPGTTDDATISALCDRRRGVGADGVLIVDRSGAEPSMIVRNADGSRPEMCGNGLRCVLGYLLGGTSELHVSVRTDAGLLACDVWRAAGEVIAQIEMGRARMESALELGFDGEAWSFERVNMGNPHAIVFRRPSDALIERLGPAVEHAVPGGTNVEFVTAESSGLTIRVWERGVGFTDACGTGACAVVALACRSGRAPFDQWITARLPGGTLDVKVASETLAVTLRGAATHVFTGSTHLA
ncbi:MAG: diaminopimelate epimerase [Polyangiaceae bacterium]